MQSGRLALIEALYFNVTLKSINMNMQIDPLPLTPIYKEFRTRNTMMNKGLDVFIEDSKLFSFRNRMKIALFIRGTCTFLDCVALRLILELLIGPGPQVARFMRYRIVRSPKYVTGIIKVRGPNIKLFHT